MSHAIPVVPVDNMDGGDHRPASPAQAIGFTYVPGETSTLRRVLDDAEVQAISRALQHTGWNRKRAAALLKISYRGLLYKIRRHSITPPLAGS
jgi:two-component system, NtrC family, response regulator AtoC